MIKYVVIPGLVYQGETDEEAEERDRRMLEYNRRVEELEKRNALPMEGYREWAMERGLCVLPMEK